MRQHPAEILTTAIPSIEFVEHTLSNGLRVVLSKESRIPCVAINMTFHVGSKNDDPARTGMAHLIEHLMFEGSPNVPKGKFDEILNNNGGDSNAYTTWDTTGYFINLPSAHIETAFWLDSDRIAGFGISEEALRIQKEVVAEEKLMYVDNSPYGTIEEESAKRLFGKSGYRWPIIGNMDDLGKTTIDELVEFHKKYYSPSNAVLSVVGDIDYDRTLEQIEKYYGGIAPGTPAGKTAFDEDELLSEIVADLQDNIHLKGKFIFYRTPPAGTKEYYALNLLSGILSDGESSRFVSELEYERELVNEIDTTVYGLEQTGVFAISALILNGKDPQRVQSIIDGIIQDVVSGNLTEKEIQKVKNRIETYYNSGRQSIIALADKFSFLKTFYNDCGRINAEVMNYLTLTSEDITDAAVKYLDPDRRVILNYSPGK